MTEEIAKTASELLKLKSQYTDDLSKILDKPKDNGDKFSFNDDYYYLSLCYGYSGGFLIGSNYKYRLNVDNNKEICKKVNDLLVVELNREITEIDEKLKKLSC